MSHDYPDPHHDHYAKTIFGFWLFLLTDFVLFGTLFATYVVLAQTNMPFKISATIINIDYAGIQSFFLLTASFFAGLGGASAHRKNRAQTLIFFGLTFFFASIFTIYEFLDMSRLIHLGYTWQHSGLLSGFYTLIGTHFFHLVLGLIWVIVLLIPVIKEGLTAQSILRLSCLRMFFQFLNIIWVFTFTIVYFLDKGGI
jgi:cytochrome o ubiquinol oxidase subunit 3